MEIALLIRVSKLHSIYPSTRFDRRSEMQICEIYFVHRSQCPLREVIPQSSNVRFQLQCATKYFH